MSFFRKLFRIEPPPPRRRSQDTAGEFSGVFAGDVTFRGTLRGDDNYRVYGTVQGDADLNASIMLMPGSLWVGDIVADYVHIAGEVVGDVKARVGLELAATAKVTGNLASPRMGMAEGAMHEGKIKVPGTGAVTRFAERRGESS